MLAPRQSDQVDKKINGHDEGGGQYSEKHGMTRLMDERAVREKHAKNEHTGSYERKIIQIVRLHAPHYSNAGTISR
jgi:hypothetical protein